MTAPTPLRIGLLWHSLRAGNLGVGALTLGNVAVIRSVAEELGISLQLTAFTMAERATAPIDGDVAAFEITAKSMASPAGFWAHIKQQDCVIDIGAGDSWTDIYHPKRFAYLWLSKVLALKSGKPLIFAPQTIGPFTKPVYKALAAYPTKRAEAVIARDPASFAAIRKLAPHVRAEQAVDVAFLMRYEDRSAERSSVRGEEALRIGINVSGLLAYQAQSGENLYGLSYDYLRLQRRLIAHWQGQGHKVHLLTHATSAGMAHDNDAAFADLLARDFPGTVRVPDFAGPREAKSYISSLDFLVAGRMHACVAAFSAQVPVVPLAYSRKFDALFAQLGYPHSMPVKGLSDESAFAFVLNAFAERDQLQAQEKEGMRKVEGLMEPYREVLRACFARLASQG